MMSTADTTSHIQGPTAPAIRVTSHRSPNVETTACHWRRLSRLLLQARTLSIVGLGLLSGPAMSQTNPVVAENQLPGTTDWDISSDHAANDVAGQIKGYASATSVNKGESIVFYVSVAPAQTYTIDVYRIGWYQGLGGRRVAHVGPVSGTQQAACPAAPVTGLIECNWSPSYTLMTETTWTSGVYLAVLTNANSFQNYIQFVVRDDARVAQLVYQQPVNTHQAYNNYPNNGTGKSLYDFNSSGAITVGGTRAAVKVSYDRPYADIGLPDDVRSWEVNFIRWMERSGYDVTYTTSVDTHASGGALLNYSGFLSVGHDEYWSREMFDAAVHARDSGVNLAFFTADAIYWQVRMEASTSGVPNRVIVCYRDPSVDPVADPALKTYYWREPPVNRPEQTLLGVQYSGNPPYVGPGFADYVVTNSSNWVYAGTGFVDGDKVRGIVGYEADRYFPDFSGPPAVPGTYTLLSSSPYPGDHSNSSVYQAASGAWVFAAGTIDWPWALDSYGPGYYLEDQRLQRATANILDRFSSGQRPDFFLSTLPTSRTVTAGTGTTFAVSVSVSGGFSEPVSLGVSGLPPGAAGTFDVNPATSASTLSITTTAATPVGTYPITITGASGALIHTTTASLVVVTPDFVISASPSTRTIAIGASTTYTVTLTPIAAFADPVTLDVAGLPAGTTGSFTVNPATTSSVLTVSSAAGAAGGNYPLTITGTSGALSHSVNVSLTVDAGVTVTAPNTATSWRASTKQNITFSHKLGVGHVMNIEVSRDAGATWSLITTYTTTSATSGTYAWTVSGPATNRALIRVSSASNPLVSDTSDVVFSIVNPVITVTAPNTGVKWRAGSTQSIKFSHNMAVGSVANIEVSRDGGSVWEFVKALTTTSSTSGAYSWVVPGPPTTRARVRVSWALDPAVSDTSDVDFTILPRVTVTAPNTAVTWTAGTTRKVSWSHNLGLGGTVDISLSPDNGVTWILLASGVASSASTTGTVNIAMPLVVTTQALIRISPTTDPASGDTSDVPFTLVAPVLAVTAPNTSVSWSVGSSKSITWTHNLGTLDYVKIELARDGVNFTEVISSSVKNSGATSGSYSWTVTGPATSTAKVRVTWLGPGSLSDDSNVTFKIQ